MPLEPFPLGGVMPLAGGPPDEPAPGAPPPGPLVSTPVTLNALLTSTCSSEPPLWITCTT